MKFYRAIQNFVSNNYANCSCGNKTITSILNMINHRIMHCFSNIMKATFDTFSNVFLIQNDVEVKVIRIIINQKQKKSIIYTKHIANNCKTRRLYYRSAVIYSSGSNMIKIELISGMVLLFLSRIYYFVDYVTLGYFICCSCISN